MKIKIDESYLSKLEQLALIRLKNEEKDKISNDLQRIIDFFEKINELELKDVEPLFHPISSGKLRKDEPLKPLNRDEALQNVKRKENGYIVGPRTYGE
ncbi:Asp-tRNA(Asn) amidotransferase subunit GatC [Sulfolobus acidocaldarius]|uniref:Aspartyl/glutamyl-tRNA(Asn/Gln) amidotransferase subunit C n=4 Tax=Sulfolobus acidocaldarius TaxID=2285 RepID=GATC_SULAC|nr:Asp-tRNA(Asn) amidotransferase subunit GatC [Sulfolobus acidocaldarius]Q4J966.1 RecName: Full=Aspartyl/glutamyl-tRNA(Asn/Gln) amidotransferase subunit C; Short=Asp/Glu-ADT subunit C [Sulfolobus acidocaldarius DSM 639]AHC51597.1 glutamyl-tRNA amidotransferase subunit C [Sulfolobus acidocaldarius SUSAZ]AAY80664.1 glutamyl-tRNA(Gln) amidotransferase subunit C [Sulfolobus acidocaldarius DSM 639]AGE71261.1 aspartyl/glutamyl-tRNA amidotransferase subunit C [Sulfolobus acidocaldarius N8]AGE73530.1